MFNVGDRVKCISGGNKGLVGVVTGLSTPWGGKPRVVVTFDKEGGGGAHAANLWSHRFILYKELSKEELVIQKVRAMEKRQTWEKAGNT